MANMLLASGSVGGDMCCLIIRLSDGKYYDAVHNLYAATPPVIAGTAMALTELGSTGRFTRTLPGGALSEAAGKDILVQYMAKSISTVAYTDPVVSSEILHVNAAGDDTDSEVGGTTQPRINKPVGKGFLLQISDRRDGTHGTTQNIYIRPGSVGSLGIGIDMSPLFGQDRVNTVGTPTVAASGELIATASGPRDTEAVITLSGTAVAGTTYTITVPVTMDTGEQVNVDFKAITFSS